MGNKRKRVVTWTEDGTQYIRAADCGIQALILAIDGFTLFFFGKEKRAHVRLLDALDWHRNEMPHTKDPKTRALRARAIASLEELAASRMAQ